MSLTKAESALAVAALSRRVPRYTFEQLRIVLEHVELLKRGGHMANQVFQGLTDFFFDESNQLLSAPSDLALARRKRVRVKAKPDELDRPVPAPLLADLAASEQMAIPWVN